MRWREEGALKESYDRLDSVHSKPDFLHVTRLIIVDKSSMKRRKNYTNSSYLKISRGFRWTELNRSNSLFARYLYHIRHVYHITITICINNNNINHVRFSSPLVIINIIIIIIIINSHAKVIAVTVRAENCKAKRFFSITELSFYK